MLCKQEDGEDRARRIQKSNACPLHNFSKGSVPSEVQKQEGKGRLMMKVNFVHPCLLCKPSRCQCVSTGLLPGKCLS